MKPFWRILGGAASAAALACSSPATVGRVAPVTGVILRAESATGGQRCGRGDDEVFRYAALVQNADGAVVGAGIYDCFSDAAFVDLGPSSTGLLVFTIRVFTFDFRLWSNLTLATVEGALSSPEAMAQLRPTSATSCIAEQQAQVAVLATCGPAAVRLDSADLRTETFAPVCDDGQKSVLVRYRTQTLQGPPVDVPSAGGVRVSCQSSAIVVPVPAPAVLELEVEVTSASGAPAGATTCRAVTSFGVTAAAVCDPVTLGSPSSP